jgi:peptide/nickel transport system substrate-binding protein
MHSDRPARTRRTRLAIAVTIAAVAALATACGGSSGNSAGGGSASSNGANISLTVEASPTGPITDNFNPFSTTSPGVLLGAESMVYEPLLQYNLAKPNQTYPWLASSYAFSNGDKTLTFQLRHGVKWSDGKPFTSADVVFTFDMMKKYPAINTLDVSFSTVSAPNPYEVVFTFPSPAYVQLYNIAGDTPVVPQHLWAGVTNPSAYADSTPVGTGPYVVQTINQQGITLTRNPDYWQPGLPKIGKLFYQVYDSNTSANLALQQGQLDWAGNFMPHIQQTFSSQDPSHRFYSFPPERTAYLELNLTRAPFNNVKVRQALSMALDRAAVINAGEYGEQPAAQSPTGLVLPVQSSQLAPGFAADNYTAPNLTQARSLLESAGFTYSNGHLYEPGGKPFTLTIIAPSAYTDVMTDFQVVANQWDALGASVTLDGEAVPSWIQQSETGDYQVSIGGGASPETVDPWGSYNELLNSSLASPVGQPSVGDGEHFDSPQADALLTQWANATTDAARQQAEDGIENIMVSQVPVIPLFYNVMFSEWTTTKVTGWPTASNQYEVPSPLGEQAEVVALHLTPAS